MAEVREISRYSLAVMKALADIGKRATLVELEVAMGVASVDSSAALAATVEDLRERRLISRETAEDSIYLFTLTGDGWNTIGPALQSDDGPETPRPEAPMR